jgi:3-hydroxyisobutyrate dehydrogenase-like beta-hydroxyacid dehydrogenase
MGANALPVLGFIGLGAMGSGMCANVVRKHGAPVLAYDMNPAALTEQVGNGAKAADSARDVAEK